MSVRGIPEQDKLENQDPDVLYSIDGVTGVRTEIEVPKAKGKPGPKPKAPEPEKEKDSDDSKGAGE